MRRGRIDKDKREVLMLEEEQEQDGHYPEVPASESDCSESQTA